MPRGVLYFRLVGAALAVAAIALALGMHSPAKAAGGGIDRQDLRIEAPRPT